MQNKLHSNFKEEDAEAHEIGWPILRSWSSSITRALDHYNSFCSFNIICPVVCCFSVSWLIWLTNPRPWMGDKNQKANYWEACIWPRLSPAKQMLIYWRGSVIKETRFHIWSYQRIIYNHRQYNCSLWGTSETGAAGFIHNERQW